MLRTSITPRSFAGLQLWIDFADKASITLDANSLIQQINDKSGNGYNATQSTAANRPATSTINGLQVGDWGSASNSKALVYSHGSTANNWRDVFVVAQWDGGGSTFPAFNGVFTASVNTGTASGVGLVGDGFGTANWDTAFSWHTSRRTNGVNTAAAFSTITSPFLTQFWRSSDVGVNGYCIGSDRNNANRGWRGRIAEIAAFSRELSDAERSSLRLAMAHKWGFTF